MSENDLRLPSAGELLRGERERRGLDIAVLAVMTNVPQRKLELLEADRYDELPDAGFTRALAQAMCRALKIDTAAVLARLPRSGDPQRLEHVAGGCGTPFRDHGFEFDRSRSGILRRPAFWATAVVLLGAGVLALLPDVRSRLDDSTVAMSPAARSGGVAPQDDEAVAGGAVVPTLTGAAAPPEGR